MTKCKQKSIYFTCKNFVYRKKEEQKYYHKQQNIYKKQERKEKYKQQHHTTYVLKFSKSQQSSIHYERASYIYTHKEHESEPPKR